MPTTITPSAWYTGLQTPIEWVGMTCHVCGLLLCFFTIAQKTNAIYLTRKLPQIYALVLALVCLLTQILVLIGSYIHQSLVIYWLRDNVMMLWAYSFLLFEVYVFQRFGAHLGYHAWLIPGIIGFSTVFAAFALIPHMLSYCYIAPQAAGSSWDIAVTLSILFYPYTSIVDAILSISMIRVILKSMIKPIQDTKNSQGQRELFKIKFLLYSSFVFVTFYDLLCTCVVMVIPTNPQDEATFRYANGLTLVGWSSSAVHGSVALTYLTFLLNQMSSTQPTTETETQAESSLSPPSISRRTSRDDR